MEYNLTDSQFGLSIILYNKIFFLMKKIIFISPIVVILIMGASLITAATNIFENTKISSDEEDAGNIFLADPTIFFEQDKYYLTGTGFSPTPGFILLESENLKDWNFSRPDSMILRQGHSTFGNKGFWAPQIIKNENTYWLTYTANEQTALASSQGLKELFTQDQIQPIDSTEKNIDSFLFKDDDGKWYLYHVRFNQGNFLWVGEFNPDTEKIVDGTLTQCFKNDQSWETTPAFESVPIMEGPTVIKLDGKYYLFYSANHFQSPDYAVGYAISDSPLGPWVKNPDNPIIHRSIVKENGSGHGDIFKDIEGNYKYVYHVHNSDKKVSPRRTRIISLNLDKDKVSGIYKITANKESVIKVRLVK